MTTAVGYASSSHYGIHFGLRRSEAGPIQIKWPSGRVQVIAEPGRSRIVEVEEPK
jgi:hypothetical protein